MENLKEILQVSDGLMVARGKVTQVVVVAIARELVAFMWDIARRFPAIA